MQKKKNRGLKLLTFNVKFVFKRQKKKKKNYLRVYEGDFFFYHMHEGELTDHYQNIAFIRLRTMDMKIC